MYNQVNLFTNKELNFTQLLTFCCKLSRETIDFAFFKAISNEQNKFQTGH